MRSAVFLENMFVVAVILICSVAPKVATAKAALVNNATRLLALTANLIAAPLTGENNAA